MKTQLDWQDGQPFSSLFGDIYFSRTSGLKETEYVFILHNNLLERFTKLAESAVFSIGETGFGTGLNFLVTWKTFLEYAPPNARLCFLSTEKFPLAPGEITQALSLFPELRPVIKPFLEAYQHPLTPGGNLFSFADGRISLQLFIGDAQTTLSSLCGRFDAWFLDGFAPAKNPDMWHTDLLNAIARISHLGTTFATFTSASQVRHALAANGFAVNKAPGFGHKREMCYGKLIQLPTAIWHPPWFDWPMSSTLGKKEAIIVGGGIAGASTAHSLAKRGWRITLLEQHTDLAQEASGNPQGILYVHLSPQFVPLTQLTLMGYSLALRTLPTHLRLNSTDWQRCGMLQLAYSAKEAKQQALLLQAGINPRILYGVNATEASQLAGIQLTQNALYFPEGGWIHPAALIKALSLHPNIQVKTQRTVQTFDYDESKRQWCVHTAQGEAICAPILILACAAACNTFNATQHLSFKVIRGQISFVPYTKKSERLRTVICGQGYICPANGGKHTLGASFKHSVRDLTLSDAEHLENQGKLATMAPALFEALGGEHLHITQGRTGLRCTGNDNLPLVGPISPAQPFVERYQRLRIDATFKLPGPTPWLPGLYINAGHGSHGLLSAPASAELLACALNHEPLPFPRLTCQALHPNRFLVRDLARHKI